MSDQQAKHLPNGPIGDLLAYGHEQITSALSRKDRNDYQFWEGWVAALDRAALVTSNRETDSTKQILRALKNYGADITCGACMEIAFSGVTTNKHSCKQEE